MRCAPGTHEAAAELLRRRGLARDLHVLDLASGTGAFLARLRDEGFQNLHAVELNLENFDLGGVTPQVVDLNSDFAAALRGDMGLVTAIEIIEHLDCPRAFLRNIHTLLSGGGHLLLTTPNVAHWLGRLRFALSGELRQFQRRDYDYQRHISPTTHVQVRLMFEEIGFELLDFTTAGTFFGPVKLALTWPASALAGAMLGKLANGDVAIYLARKVAAGEATRPPASPGLDSFYFRTTGA
jgi:2-polyprenyl-3-methyl-5-hydroxy-6-metoxy-1,4-benzoquinol methylase